MTAIIVSAVAVPVGTAMVGGISLMIKDSWKAKSADQQLQYAAAQVQFINNWVQTRRLSEQVTDAPTPLDWLDTCLRTTERQMVAAHRKEKNVNLCRLLMLDPLKSRVAQFARVLFWLSIAFFNLAGIRGIADIVSGAKGPEALTVSEMVSNVVTFGTLAIAFREWSKHAEKKFSKRSEASEAEGY
ncbi:hypothetical protein [Streptomyces sp. NPDC002676]